MTVTLDRLLASREARADFQKELLESYPGKTLVCLTVIVPGPVKRNQQSLVVAQAAVTALVTAFSGSTLHLELRDLPTGYEGYLVTSLSNLEAKELTCGLEDSHPLGRLFDLDVITADGTPLSRQAVGRSPRKCLICGQEALWCMRNRTHSIDELNARIREMIEAYVQ